MHVTAEDVTGFAGAETAVPGARAIIAVESLTKRFGAVTALEDIDLRIGEGEFVAIMGPSGSGKTTLLNILSCLDTPSEGRYALDGIDTSSLNSAAGRRPPREDRLGVPAVPPHPLPERGREHHAGPALPQHGRPR